MAVVAIVGKLDHPTDDGNVVLSCVLSKQFFWSVERELGLSESRHLSLHTTQYSTTNAMKQVNFTFTIDIYVSVALL